MNRTMDELRVVRPPETEGVPGAQGRPMTLTRAVAVLVSRSDPNTCPGRVLCSHSLLKG